MFIEMKRKVALKRESIFYVMGCLLLLAGCGRKQTPIEVSEAAQYFRLTDTLGMVRADVFDPQNKGKLLARYYLVDEGARIKDERLNSNDSANSNTKVISPSSCIYREFCGCYPCSFAAGGDHFGNAYRLPICIGSAGQRGGDEQSRLGV